MAGTSVKLNNDLWARVKRVSEAGGYSSPQEFIEHVLNREISKLDEAQSDEEIVLKLKGLGYLD